MRSLITVLQAQRLKVIVFSLAAVMIFAAPAAAQHGLSLSSQSDFSTKDRLFEDGETIYIKVEPRADFDAMSVTESSFKVEPARGGDEYNSTLSMQDDGSFTGSVEVSALEGNSTAWHLKVKIEDELDHEYEARTVFVIHGRSGNSNVFHVTGTVEAASESEISVGGYRIGVTSDTRLLSRIDVDVDDLEGHEVVVSVRREADETLTALHIFVKGEQEGTIRFVGRIQSVGESSIEIREVEFVVNEHTLIYSWNREPLDFSDLEPRMHVRVGAYRTENGWLATSIIARVGDGDEDGDDEEEEEEVEGMIEAIGDGFIEVSGIHLEVSDRTEFEGADGLDDLEVGMEVEVEFVTTEAGAHVATKIEVEDEDEDDDDDRRKIKVEGLIRAIGDRSITVEGIEFRVTGDTKIKGHGRDRLEFDDLSTGLYVEVEGFVREGTPIADKISVKGEKENRVLLRGEITALGERTATVGDTEFQVTDETVIRGERGADLTFEDLEVGLHAMVHLTGGDDGSWTALRIKVKRPFEVDDVEITGRIEAVSSTEITVREHTFSITEDTEISNRDGDEIGAEDLNVGMVAKVEGHIAEDGGLVATEIKIRSQLHQEGRFAGLVTAIGDAVLAVNGVEFEVSVDTILEGAETLGDVAIGTRVKLWFRRLGDGALLALRIQVTTGADAEAELKGAIEEIDGDGIVVAGVEVTVTATTSIEDEVGTSVSLADLAVGQGVEVEGIAVAGGILATKIKVEDGLVVSGAIDDQAESTVSLAGMTFVINRETLIIGRDNALLTVDDLNAGAYVEVIAVAETEASGENGSIMTAERVLLIESTTTLTSSEEPGLPDSFRLEQNYPNPFNPTTSITFAITASAAGHVSLNVYNVLGQQVATLVDGSLSAGTYTYRWDGHSDAGRAAASGIYLYRLRAGDQTATRSMILTK